MAQQKNPGKPNPQTNQKTTGKVIPANQKEESPKTYGKEPPMVDPQTPDHPDEYEVNAGENQTDEKPTLH